MPITFEEVTQTVLSLVRRISELEAENSKLKEVIGKMQTSNVREPDNKLKE